MSRTLDELLAELSPRDRRDVELMAEQMKLEYHLYHLREALKLTQTEMAKQMNVTQPTVAAIEKRGKDLKLLTLKRYVEALGGKMRIDVELPTGDHFAFEV